MVAPTSGDGIFDYLWLIIALPALGAAVILLLGERRTHGWAHYVGTATVAGSFLVSLWRSSRCSAATSPTAP